MPLIQGSSSAAVNANTQREVEAGKKPDQAYAIANAIARKIKALGGKPEDSGSDEPVAVNGKY